MSAPRGQIPARPVLRRNGPSVDGGPGAAVRGRGAYLCPSAACFAKALKKRTLERTLREPRLEIDEKETRLLLERAESTTMPLKDGLPPRHG
ncbi:MAG: YlxR family protein [Deltaproteobacteria bacterium]|nr:YlxR family protein [Deltaproteobacteria bacterium]